MNQLTENGEYQYPWIRQDRGVVRFSKTYNTCYFQDKTFKKIKGGGNCGGNYYCIETGDEYRISQ